jgi:O-antigen ligase
LDTAAAEERTLNTNSAHNSYLLFLAEMGLAGAIPFGILLLLLFFKGFRSTWELAKINQVWAIGIFAGFVGMSVHLWAMAALTNTSAWLIYGLMAASIMVSKRVAARVSNHSRANAPVRRSTGVFGFRSQHPSAAFASDLPTS